MSCNFTAPIDNLMHWHVGAWRKFDHGISNACLRIHCDQLVLSHHNKIIESLNLNGKIKGFYKDDVLILAFNDKGCGVRKIRFRLQSNVKECLKVLGEHCPVMNHAVRSNSTDVISSKYRNIEEVLKHAVQTMEGETSSDQPPANLANFIKLCLLDPTFPQIVKEAQNIVNNL